MIFCAKLCHDYCVSDVDACCVLGALSEYPDCVKVNNWMQGNVRIATVCTLCVPPRVQ